MSMKILAAIGVGLTITAAVSWAQQLPSNHGTVPVPYLPAAREEPGKLVRCSVRDALSAGVFAHAHARLGVTPDQESAWAQFTQTFQQALKPMEALCNDVDEKAAPPDTLSDLIERKEHSMEVTLEVLKSIRLAVSDLESALNPEQKQRLIELALSLE